MEAATSVVQQGPQSVGEQEKQWVQYCSEDACLCHVRKISVQTMAWFESCA